MILKCKCKNEYQEKKYGNSLRVHNPCKKEPNKPQYWRCTVCLNVKEGPNQIIRNR